MDYDDLPRRCDTCDELFDPNDDSTTTCPDCLRVILSNAVGDNDEINLEDDDEPCDFEAECVDLEPAEDDIVTDDHINFYQSGKLILSVEDEEEWAVKVNEFCEREKFWPNVWWISDHGNAHQIDMFAALAHADERTR